MQGEKRNLTNLLSAVKNRPIILHEDEQMLLVYKPSGLLTIPDRYDPQKANLQRWLQNSREQVLVVHRLDRETSGLICFAKTKQAHQLLNSQFQQRTVDKVYLALVDGHLSQKEGIIDGAIAPSKSGTGKMLVAKNGKPSLTTYRVLESFSYYSLIEATIKTGRTHQVRVHFQSIGHPLAIDALYGQRDRIFLSSIKGRKYRRGKNLEERPLMSRTTLHAHRLSFDHPTSGERMQFESELPKDFSALLKQLRKWDGS